MTETADLAMVYLYDHDPEFHGAVHVYMQITGKTGFTDDDGVRHDGPTEGVVREVYRLWKAGFRWTPPSAPRLCGCPRGQSDPHPFDVQHTQAFVGPVPITTGHSGSGQSDDGDQAGQHHIGPVST